MVRPLAAHVAFREAVQFGVNERCEFLEGLLLAVAPCFQELGKLVSPRLVHWGTSGPIATGKRRGIYHIAELKSHKPLLGTGLVPAALAGGLTNKVLLIHAHLKPRSPAHNASSAEKNQCSPSNRQSGSPIAAIGPATKDINVMMTAHQLVMVPIHGESISLSAPDRALSCLTKLFS